MRTLGLAMLVLTLLTLLTTSSAQAKKEEELCHAHRDQCEKDAKSNNRSAILNSCQNCYLTCRPFAPETHPKERHFFRYCLGTCVNHDCIGHEAANSSQVAHQFRCHVYRRWCFNDDMDRNQGDEALKKSCGTCAKACNAASNFRMFCEDRCAIRRFSCAASSSRNATNLNTPLNSKGNDKTWEWLGPVLGAVATIIGAIITVVWVRDFRQTRTTENTVKYPPSPPPIERRNDEVWSNSDNSSTGLAELLERVHQQPVSGRRLCFRAGVDSDHK